MTNVTTFNPFEETGITQEIRVVDIKGEPWFVGADACKALEINLKSCGEPNVTVATRKLDESEVTLHPIQGKTGSRVARVISESGLYKLIMRCDKPQARPFQDWVTKVVLPAIRKDNAYIKGEEQVATGEMSEDEFVLKAMTILQGKVERLTQERDQIQAKYDHKVNNLTIGEFLYDIGEFVSHGDKIRMSAICRRIMASVGAQRVERPMKITVGGEERDTKVYVYPRDVLITAHQQIKAMA